MRAVEDRRRLSRSQVRAHAEALGPLARQSASICYTERSHCVCGGGGGGLRSKHKGARLRNSRDPGILTFKPVSTIRNGQALSAEGTPQSFSRKPRRLISDCVIYANLVTPHAPASTSAQDRGRLDMLASGPSTRRKCTSGRMAPRRATWGSQSTQYTSSGLRWWIREHPAGRC